MTVSLVPWLTRLQQQQVELRQQEYNSPAQFQEKGDIQPLFESILRFQNYPLSLALSREGTGSSLDVRNVRWVDRWPYPLNVEIIPRSELLLKISYQQRHFGEEAIPEILNHFQALIETFLHYDNQSMQPVTIDSILDTLTEQTEL